MAVLILDEKWLILLIKIIFWAPQKATGYHPRPVAPPTADGASLVAKLTNCWLQQDDKRSLSSWLLWIDFNCYRSFSLASFFQQTRISRSRSWFPLKRKNIKCISKISKSKTFRKIQWRHLPLKLFTSFEEKSLVHGEAPKTFLMGFITATYLTLWLKRTCTNDKSCSK